MRRLLLLPLLLVGCAPEPELTAASRPEAPALKTAADSLAFRIVEASGGMAAWEALPALRFDFAVERGGERVPIARHLWDRRSGRYRAEWNADRDGTPDSAVVALFARWPDEAAVYLNGEPVDSLGDGTALEAARGRTINDTYWLLAPLKLFDPGVTRALAPDSADAAHDALRLTFAGVGMTPGDRYWLLADRETGRLDRWTFRLEGRPDRAASYRWTGYETLDGPAGPVTLSTRKEAVGADRALLTDRLSAAPVTDPTLFTDPQPRL